MKRVFLFCLVAGMLVFGMRVEAYGVGEYIERFDVVMNIQSDASVRVTEEIRYVFGDNDRHGIFRTIPTEYETPLGSRSIGLSDVAVIDDEGTPQPFSLSQEGSDKKIKIGDPDVFVSGAKTYRLSYTVSRVVTYTEEYDEVYWNVTGAQWSVPIMHTRAEVVLPQALARTGVRVACYEGSYGSTQPCTRVEDTATSVERIRFEASRLLEKGEGLTVAVGFEKGIVSEPTTREQVVAVAKDNWIVVVPLLVFAIMFWLWYTRGRDPKGRGTIIAEYDAPDQLTPLEVSAVRKGTAENTAVTAEIIYLAVRGYLKVTRVVEQKLLVFSTTDYVFTKTKSGEDLTGFDATLFQGLFKKGDEVKLSDLKNVFYETVFNVQKAVARSIVQKKYYPEDPTKVFGVYLVVGVLGVFGMLLLQPWFGFIALLSGAASGAVVILFAFVMPKVTRKGAIAREAIEGLKLYLDVAEKDRIAFHNAPEKNPQLFEKLLPYAMVLGVENEWAKQFEGVYMQPPSWYSDGAAQAFNPALFAASLGAFSTEATSTLSGAPSGGTGSGGGGFSGGGFGGGGGGSW